jgi:ABC-type multidrug transport system permease subunit
VKLSQSVQLARLFWAEDRTQYMLIVLTVLSVPLTLAYLASRVLPASDAGGPAVTSMALTFAFMTGLTQVGTGVVQDRFTGRLAMLRTLCTDKTSYLLSRSGLGVAECMAIAGLTWVTAIVSGLTAPGARSLWTVLAVAATGGASMSALGVCLAAHARDRSSGWALVSVTGMLLALLSPVLYREAALPLWLRPLAWLSPYTHIRPQLDAVFAAQPIPWARTFVCLLQALGFGVWAHRSLQW